MVKFVRVKLRCEKSKKSIHSFFDKYQLVMNSPPKNIGMSDKITMGTLKREWTKTM